MTAALAASATLPPVAGAKPVRVQRKRTRGWKMPDNTIYVGRPTKWGNPYSYKGSPHDVYTTIAWYEEAVRGDNRLLHDEDLPTVDEVKKELRGKNLACWCKEGEPCHADILLEIANAD